MSQLSHVTIRRAGQLDGEEAFVNSIVDDLSDETSKLIYADWLAEHGDTRRADFLRQYAAAFRSMKVADFPSMKKIPVEWVRMIGAKLVRAIAANDLAEHRDKLLPLAKPALIYEAVPSDSEEFENDAEIPIGGSKLFGLPDLPVGSTWPRQKDCKVFYFEDSGIDPETPCGFVGQINLAELAGTQVARRCPSHGLLSFFACSEVESIGMTDGHVIYTPNTTNLARMEPLAALIGPDAKEANRLLDARNLTLSETWELPYPGDESPFPDVQFEYSNPLYDACCAVLEESDGGEQLNSILGYTRPTTGDDPLPGGDWCKLICVEESLGIRLHFCVRNEDLAAGKFDNLQIAFIDFD